MSSNLDRICTVDISLAKPIANNANFNTVLILGPAPKNPKEDVPLIGAYNGLEELTALGVIATGEDADPIGVAARVAFSQSPAPHEVYVAYMGNKPLDSTDALSLPRMSQALGLGDKKVSDLIARDVKVLENGYVVGTLKEVESWPEFSDKPDEQHGNYIPLLLPKGGKKVKTTKGDVVKEMNFPDDRLLVIHVPGNSTTCKIEIDDVEIITLNFAATALAPDQAPSIKIPSDPMTITDAMELALATPGWYCVCPVGLTDAQTVEVIQWTETQTKICGYQDTDPENPLVEPGIYYRSFPTYPKVTKKQMEDDIPLENIYGLAVAMAVKAMNFQAGSETWALKELAAVTPADLSATFIKTLEGGNSNFLITVASCNLTQGGKMNAGEWIDVIRFRDWLQNDMQVRVVNLLKVRPKVPYTDGGIALVQNQMIASLKDGQRVGGISPTEYDADSNEIPGFVTSVPLAANITAVQKASRKLIDVNFAARIAGAIHVVEIKGTLTYESL